MQSILLWVGTDSYQRPSLVSLLVNYCDGLVETVGGRRRHTSCKASRFCRVIVQSRGFYR